MRHRQKSGDRVRDDGDRKNLRHLIEHFNLPGAQELYDALESPDKNRKLPYCGCEPLHPAKSLPSTVNFDDLHYLMQVNQARALTAAVEWWRSRQPRCMGTLYWQLNDCWPAVSSWSCVDGDGRKKPLWYATQYFFHDVIYTVQPEADGSLHFFIVNDSDHPMDGKHFVWRLRFDGTELARQLIELEVAPRSVGRVKLNPDLSTPDDPTRELIQPHFGSPWFFKPDKELNYPSPAFEVDWEPPWFTIRTRATILRDVCIFVDRLDPAATINAQLMTLVGDDEIKIKIESKLPLTKEQLTSPPVFRCVNPFGAR
jgi:beta-mannosidase